MKSNKLILTVVLGGVMLSTAAASDVWKPTLMDETTEVQEALAAGPESIRAEAGVYVLTRSGYRLVRESTNGFHCIVGRSQRDSFEPQCFDAIGSESLLHQTLLRGRLQMEGKPREEIQQAIRSAWDRGELKAPAGPGINYMLSDKNRVPVTPDRVVSYQPHLMFYAPHLTNTEIGGDNSGATSPIFMINAGSPSGYVIVPFGAQYGEAVASDGS